MTKLFAQGAEIFRQWKEADVAGNRASGGGADVLILTSTGRRIPAHSKILASTSPVLERKLSAPMKNGKSEKVIRILGVPDGAVILFVGLVYAGCDKEGEEIMKKYGMHLLVLSHVYQVTWLKRACEIRLAAWLNSQAVVDVLKLARLCNAAWLGLRCLKLVKKDFAAVQKSDAWHFLQDNDPQLELYILRFLDESDFREKRRRRNNEEQKVYQQLSEAMECLVHIFKEGCTDINADRRRRKISCPSSAACRPLQLLLLHFSKCNGDRAVCYRCRQIWQLIKLHSVVCVDHDSSNCKVPLCRQFKYKMLKMEGKLEERRKWMVLGKKVASIIAFSSLAKRKELEWREYYVRSGVKCGTSIHR